MQSIIWEKLREEIIFIAALLLTILTSFWVKPTWEAINFKVVLSLFNLMIISLAFAKYNLLEYIAIYLLSVVKTKRSLGLLMIGITAILGMLITNDVALITIVPITISIAKQAGFNPYKIVAFETVAANIGSSLTPFGNPQNLYLYSFYHIDTIIFFKITFPFLLIGLILLCFIGFKEAKDKLSIPNLKIQIINKKRVFFYTILFLLVLLSVVRLLDYLFITILVVVAILVMDRPLFLKVDYYLLGTFICFFLFVNNVMQLTALTGLITSFLEHPLSVYGISVLLSQVISNVPTAVLLSGFTNNFEALLLGVSAGGLGTLIASLANLIAYKCYIKEYNNKPYLGYFTVLNFGLLIVISLFIVLIIIN